MLNCPTTRVASGQGRLIPAPLAPSSCKIHRPIAARANEAAVATAPAPASSTAPPAKVDDAQLQRLMNKFLTGYQHSQYVESSYWIDESMVRACARPESLALALCCLHQPLYVSQLSKPPSGTGNERALRMHCCAFFSLLQLMMCPRTAGTQSHAVFFPYDQEHGLCQCVRKVIPVWCSAPGGGAVGDEPKL